MSKITSIGQQIIAAHQSGRAIDLDCHCDLSISECYQIQNQVMQAKGYTQDNIMHWKVGVNSVDGSAFSAPIFPDTVFSKNCILSRSDYCDLNVELEWAYRLNKTLTQTIDTDNLKGFEQAFNVVYCVFELVDSRLTAWKSMPNSLRLADNQLNAGLVLGDPLDSKLFNSPDKVSHQLIIDKGAVERGIGGHPLGDPMQVIIKGLNALIERTGGLKEGTIIITGSWNGLNPVQKSKDVHASFVDQYAVNLYLKE